MKIALITSSESFDNEISLIKNMLGAFEFNLHVRKPNYAAKELTNWMNEFSAKEKQNMVIHGEVGFSFIDEVAGIHRTYRDAWANGTYISTACHSFAELDGIPSSVDYAFLSPIYDSISKTDYPSQFKEKELRDYFEYYEGKPVYALGGVRHKNIHDVKSIGFGGAALCGSVWQDKNPFKAMEKMVEKCQE